MSDDGNNNGKDHPIHESTDEKAVVADTPNKDPRDPNNDSYSESE